MLASLEPGMSKRRVRSRKHRLKFIVQIAIGAYGLAAALRAHKLFGDLDQRFVGSESEFFQGLFGHGGVVVTLQTRDGYATHYTSDVVITWGTATPSIR
jgi:urea transporter